MGDAHRRAVTVAWIEAESAFYDPQVRLFQDVRHSTAGDPRYVLYRRSLEARVLMVGFTRQGRKIRVITARPASRKERRIHEVKS